MVCRIEHPADAAAKFLVSHALGLKEKYSAAKMQIRMTTGIGRLNINITGFSFENGFREHDEGQKNHAVQ